MYRAIQSGLLYQSLYGQYPSTVHEDPIEAHTHLRFTTTATAATTAATSDSDTDTNTMAYPPRPHPRLFVFNSSIDSARICASIYEPANIIRETSYAMPTVVFLHQWLLTSSMWGPLIDTLLAHNIQCITIDRRGFGESDYRGPDAPGNITATSYARDVRTVLQGLRLTNFVLAGSGIGCNESLLTLTQQPRGGEMRFCRGLLWVAPLLPHVFSSNPAGGGMPTRRHWDDMRGQLMPGSPGRERYIWNMLCEMERQEGPGHDAVRVNEMFNQILRANPEAVVETLNIFMEPNYDEHLLILSDKMARSVFPVAILHGVNDRGVRASETTSRLMHLLPNAQYRILEGAGPNVHQTRTYEIATTVRLMLGIPRAYY